MNEYDKRKEAISRYQHGEKITFIVRSLHKTRQWFYFWLARFNGHNEEETWFIEQSKAPRGQVGGIGGHLRRHDALSKAVELNKGSICSEGQKHHRHCERSEAISWC